MVALLRIVFLYLLERTLKTGYKPCEKLSFSLTGRSWSGDGRVHAQTIRGNAFSLGFIVAFPGIWPIETNDSQTMRIRTCYMNVNTCLCKSLAFK